MTHDERNRYDMSTRTIKVRGHEVKVYCYDLKELDFSFKPFGYRIEVHNRRQYHWEKAAWNSWLEDRSIHTVLEGMIDKIGVGQMWVVLKEIQVRA